MARSPYRERDRSFAQEIIAVGDQQLASLGSAVDAADPLKLVEPRSRVLCAGLGLLSQITLRALGGRGDALEHAVARAGAMLSLLTKIDDQVIDDRAFHGGHTEGRADVRRRTRAYLAPSLRSIRTTHPANDEPRNALAADLGRALRDLSRDNERLDPLIATIAGGWEIQIEAVALLTSHPSAVTLADIASITRRISGAWLLMIAMVGALPSDAARPLSYREEAGFFAWGSAIQRADALADLAKDLADGHLSSYPGRLLWERDPDAYLDAASRGDAAAIYALVREHAVDDACLADPDEPRAPLAALEALGDVSSLLAWIRAYLTRRYFEHPNSPAASRGAPGIDASRLFPEATRSAPCSAP